MRENWPTVALAIVVDAAILTGDRDFLGCGCPTWTVETLTHELESQKSRKPRPDAREH
jgi:hypothetical protein